MARSQIFPTFIGIGAPKAGTTWLAKSLSEHPDVFMAPVKETEFWKLTDAEERLAEYAAHFAGAELERAIGEFSVRYLSLPGVPERLRRVLPQVKLILCLRNPVDQVYSYYWHLQRQNFNQANPSDAPQSIAEALTRYPDLLLTPARYATHLARWREIFPKEQFLVLLYDDIERDPQMVLERTFAFLGVDPSFRPPSTNVKGSAVRQGTSPRSETAARWHRKVYAGLVGSVYTPMKRMLGTRKAAQIKEALRVRTLMESIFMRKGYVPMDANTRELLRREFETEMVQLRQLTGLDLRSWA